MSSEYPAAPAASLDPDRVAQAHLDDAEAGIEDLLRQVGARDEPQVQLADEVRTAVHAEWRSVVEARQRRRRLLSVALVVGVAGLAATTVVGMRISHPGPLSVATIVRVEGELQVGDATLHAGSAGEVLSTGMQLQTAADGRVALNLGTAGRSGISVRVDGGSQLRLIARDRLELQAGAIYVDSGVGAADSLVVHTSAGAVRHLGTQYQVRTVKGSVPGIEVSIREGRVEIASAYGTNTGVAGERLAVSTQGTILRSALPRDDSSWQWAARVAPPFDIAGRSLSSFLDWVARETGCEVSYASVEAKRAAEALKLGGSIAGLDPATALQAVLQTTKFKRLKTADQSIRIALGDD